MLKAFSKKRLFYPGVYNLAKIPYRMLECHIVCVCALKELFPHPFVSLIHLIGVVWSLSHQKHSGTGRVPKAAIRFWNT